MTTPSLAMIPTGFKAGKLYSVLPTPIYGSELVTNGDFATGTGWTETGNITIAGGECRILSTGSFSGINQDILEIGKRYLVTFDITTSVSGFIKIGSSNGGSQISASESAVGSYSFVFTAENTRISFARVGVCDISIDNVSVKDVIANGDFDVTRATTATRVNEQGLIESMANNVPRIDYTDGGCPVLLTEPQSTNLITYSEDFSNASWVKERCTITSNNAPSPNGIIGADLLVPNTDSNTSHILDFVSSVTGTGNGIVVSIFAKKKDYNWIAIRQGNGASGLGLAFFDLDNGVVGNVTSAGYSSTIEGFGNGWYKCNMIINQSAIFSDIRPQIYVVENGTSRNIVSPDGIGGIYIWGAQAEALPYATSYIPTNGSTVTRVKDVVNNAGDVSTFNSEEGVLFWEGSGFTDSAARLISLSDGTNTNRMYIGYSSTFITAVVVVGGGLSYVYNFVSSGVSDTVKIALKYKENDFALYVNGVKKDSQLSGSIYPINILNRLSFDSGAGTSNFFGKTKQLKVFKTALSDAELTALTS